MPIRENAPPPMLEAHPSQPETMNVLLVEDHSDTALACKLILENQGCRVEVVSSVADALEILLKQPFDLILSDVGLPDGDGAKLINCVRKFCDTPAIAITGFDAPQDVTQCHKAGFNSHLAKPIEVDKLFQAMTDLTGWQPPRPTAPGGSAW